MESPNMMDWMLEEMKKSPMKISHDFDTRFRVWVEQIIPARVNAIRQCKGDVGYAMRMVKLTIDDADRLHGRVVDESTSGNLPAYAMNVEAIFFAASAAIKTYLNEVKQ